MINEQLTATIIDVLLFEHNSGKHFTPPRSFHALSYRIESEGSFCQKGKRIQARTGDIALVPSNIEYTHTGTSERILVIHFYALNDISDDIRIFSPKNPEQYRVLFNQALAIWNKKEGGFRHAALSVFYQILGKLEAEGALSSGEINGSIRDAAQYMERHLGDSDLSVHAISARFYMSDALFRRRFKSVYGISPKQYLDMLRFRYAVTLIESGYFTQKQISDRCGFSDVKYFRTAFRRFYGQSISEYKSSKQRIALETEPNL